MRITTEDVLFVHYDVGDRCDRTWHSKWINNKHQYDYEAPLTCKDPNHFRKEEDFTESLQGVIEDLYKRIEALEAKVQMSD